MDAIGWMLGLGAFYILKNWMGKDVSQNPNINQSQNNKKIYTISQDPVFQKICILLDEKRNIFITGGAGTGKSYTLQRLKERYGKQLSITSTTGISAININGQTIHAWSGIGIDNDVKDIWKTVNRIIANPILKQQILNCQMLAIDEISMLHSKTLTYLDVVLQTVRGIKKPMGGIQIIFIGDFFQLPPVVINRECRKEDFCFSSAVWNELKLEPVILKDVKRQSEINYINVLNHIREGQTVEEDWELILDRYRNMPLDIANDKSKLHLYATNKEADSFKEICFELIKSPSITFTSVDQIEYYDDDKKLIYTEKDNSKFDSFQKVFDDEFRVLRELKLKVGCRVMLLKNIAVTQGLANGSCGTITEIYKDVIKVKFDNSTTVPLSRTEFETYKYKNISLQRECKQSYKQRIVRKQFPVRLAYGITIHKSQGMTFDNLVVHLDKIFAAGQCYVALSRTTSLSGLNPLGFDPSKIAVNKDVIDFYHVLEGKNTHLSQPKIQLHIKDVSNVSKEQIIRKAIINHQKVKITYQKSQNYSNGEITQRTIIPRKIGKGNEFDCGDYNLNPQQIYIKGFCELRNAERTFQLDRIINIEIINP